MQEVDNVKRILIEAQIALRNNDSYKLKNLSNQTIHSATVHQDPDNVMVAVLVYSLGKIIEREGYTRMEGWQEFYLSLTKNLSDSIKFLEKNNLESFRNSIGRMRNSINKIDSHLSTYIKDVFYKAEINKAFKIYQHGISAEKTASLLGISMWDLSKYIGQSTTSESHFVEALPIKERIKIAEGLTKSKNIILDAGPLISLTLNGLLHVVEKFKNKFPNLRFVLTPQVSREVIDKALTIKKYELEAVKVMTLLHKGVLEMADKFVDKKALQKETNRLMNLANNVLKADGKKLQIIQEGEASCLAFANLCNCDNLIIADERTVRLLTESPDNLKMISERRLHTKVLLNKKDLREFKEFKFIRSSELLFIAYKNDLLDYTKDKLLLDAVLYAVKYSGTSISSNEIEKMKLMI